MKRKYTQRILMALLAGIVAALVGMLVDVLNKRPFQPKEYLIDFLLWIVLGWFMAKYSQKEAERKESKKKDC